MSATSDSIKYAYMPSNHPPDNWEPGNQQNLALVLSSLKAYEDGKVEECLKYFADSIDIAWDYYDGKVSKDTLRAWFTDGRNQLSSMKINMDDYETVVSKDKKNNWVSLWYKQIWTDKKGKTDSVFQMDDLKVENGKIVILDEKSRHFPKKR